MAKTIEKQKENFITATGRRKTAVARVFFKLEKGDFTINDQNVSTYFSNEIDTLNWLKPFHAVGVSHPSAQYSGTIKVQGSGKSAQMGAVIHAISRALAKTNEEFAKILRKQGLLTRDPRMVERKKYFLRKARKAPQYSKR
ncbi:MAG: 30S ribosomal protein S9 [uncultured bacterium]|uniref:Small ribosomal subunit protein uS9 n=1 Tax=candidate division WWE3 bacterium RBG_16_37_10 TaxID=1802610 RepID=A0A1F4V4S6_UNCKA|nr:MAG: 30S ribosomal protein S9 [uncultured bacterium]OGC51543.1 MAG: 30S ribosomal protein S9 [candidate division WWE3 bacterium RBG_16_37_10]